MEKLLLLKVDCCFKKYVGLIGLSICYFHWLWDKNRLAIIS
ncbi:hypothetical protein RICGR_0712 [Rickettsiella grylli]|uniref:Uncharacterized protein n=1 Tax=Rickettsiella grylli TaxID=59196 RepID=A8PMF6_9COXI|nr:hypothetical protein RICGR_0712 [Rickettsiella grylli]